MRSQSKWFTLLAILVVTSLLLTSCASIGGSKKNSITIVLAEDPPSFNPAVAQTGFDSLVMELVMLALADVDEQGNAYPQIAAELPTVDNGGVVVDEENGTMDVTWKLRQDIKWSDGVPVTADDVVFTYNAVVDPNWGYWVPGIDYVDSVEKVDDYMVVVHYNTIYPSYQTQFGGYLMSIWPAHYCVVDENQGFSNWECGKKPLSDGPFILKEWVQNDHLTFEKNPTYYETGKPAIDEVVVKIVPDEATRKLMLENGDADLDMWTPENVINELKSASNVAVSLSTIDRWTMRIFFNLAAKGTTDPVATPHPILSDLRVRKAIRMAIDTDTISQQFWYGYAKPVWTEFFRPPYNKCNVPKPVYDPEAAKALLEEAGWKDTDGDGVRECRGCTTGAADGYKMEMEFITYSEYGQTLDNTQEFIAEKLGEIGIKLNISRVEGAVLWATTSDGGIEQSGNFDMDIWDDGYSGNDPTDFLWVYYHSDAAKPDYGQNYGRFMDPTADELINSLYTLNEATRQDAFCQLATILDEQLPELILFTTVDANAHSTRLQGVQSNANEIVTWNVENWTLK